jgi:hypothetical protein
MQVRSFSSISVKNTPENLNHANSLGYQVEVKSGNIKIEIPANAYQFANNPSKLKKALGF